MKLIETDKDTLLKPLQTVTGIVERRHTLPILSNVLIERKQEKISFVATDLEIQITTSTEDVNPDSEEYAVTVAAKKLQDILRALPDKARVILETDENRLRAKAGKSRFSLQTLPVEDFPKFPEGTEPQAKITVQQKELKHMLSLVQYAMAQQDIRYYLNGLLLLLEDNYLRVVATDGHRLAFALMTLGAPQEEKKEVILPRKVVLELARLLNDSDEPVTVEILQNQVRFSFSNVILVSKVVDGKFPDYNRVIPTGYEKQFDINRLLFLQTLQRASILSNEKFRGVRLILTSGNLRIVCNNSEQEEAQEELELQYDGDALDIGFNITYLLDVLNNLSSETVRCSFGDANSSALIAIPGNDDFKYVVMPMRI
ncbi:DNA polymerase III subunit beta [Nitrosovibrio sp. Nv6]|uniref:DNA polymerase III subunit beta n=1 Tax=Nitrosovibrio sp. Nv6 TaxID=1855340 RepID=UPI0008D44BB1|nr:DNA polymerase III subunit beta [Nitrosovibrio sp. Nv6]SEP37971.1 DNA polymerase-3 subunit beta [Nitrosovibrio sp. Nv6]